MAEQRGTPEPGRFDAFELWRQWYEANEQAWTRALKEMTTTQSYAEAQGKLLEVFLSYQKLMRDAMSTQLGAMNLPSRDDVARLGELVIGLEEKVDQLDEAMDAFQPRMDRLDQTIGALPPRMDQVDKAAGAVQPRIDRLGETVGSLSPKMDRLDRAVNDLSPKIDSVVEIVHGMQQGMQQLGETVDGLARRIARMESQVAKQAEQDKVTAPSNGADEGDTESGSKPAARGNRAAKASKSE